MHKRQERTEEEQKQFDRQQLELRKHTDVIICPCGTATPILMAYKCYGCGVYFCHTCAREHFGYDS